MNKKQIVYLNKTTLWQLCVFFLMDVWSRSSLSPPPPPPPSTDLGLWSQPRWLPEWWCSKVHFKLPLFRLTSSIIPIKSLPVKYQPRWVTDHRCWFLILYFYPPSCLQQGPASAASRRLCRCAGRVKSVWFAPWMIRSGGRNVCRRGENEADRCWVLCVWRRCWEDGSVRLAAVC